MKIRVWIPSGCSLFWINSFTYAMCSDVSKNLGRVEDGVTSEKNSEIKDFSSQKTGQMKSQV